MSLVEFKHVYKSFDKKEILKDVNFTIEKGKIVGLLGKNGMGKTTIIKLLNDLLTPTSGEILVNGKNIGIESKKTISFLPERSYLDKKMTIKQIFNYFCDFYTDFNLEKARKLLNDLNLKEEDRINKMSKGMIEKLQLILVMSREVELYVLDEPLGGVDPATRAYIVDTILNNLNDGASMMISTLLVDDIERIIDHVIFVNNGEIVLSEDADKLRDEHNDSIENIFREMFKC